MLLADGQDSTAVLFVDDFSHGEVECGCSADYSFPSGNGANEVVAGEIAHSQQEEKYCQGKEDELQYLVAFQGANEHKQGEDTPQEQVPAHECVRGGFCQSHLGHYNQCYEGQPEQAVGSEGSGSEGIAFLEFHHSGDYLRDAAVKNTHSQDHGADGEKSCVMDIQQDGGHAEAHKA